MHKAFKTLLINILTCIMLLAAMLVGGTSARVLMSLLQ